MARVVGPGDSCKVQFGIPVAVQNFRDHNGICMGTIWMDQLISYPIVVQAAASQRARYPQKVRSAMYRTSRQQLNVVGPRRLCCHQSHSGYGQPGHMRLNTFEEKGSFHPVSELERQCWKQA